MNVPQGKGWFGWPLCGGCVDFRRNTCAQATNCRVLARYLGCFRFRSTPTKESVR